MRRPQSGLVQVGHTEVIQKRCSGKREAKFRAGVSANRDAVRPSRSFKGCTILRRFALMTLDGFEAIARILADSSLAAVDGGRTDQIMPRHCVMSFSVFIESPPIRASGCTRPQRHSIPQVP